ncbi:MAG: hypothetical protein WA637_05635, partial [Terriglobales bacterium]
IKATNKANDARKAAPARMETPNGRFSVIVVGIASRYYASISVTNTGQGQSTVEKTETRGTLFTNAIFLRS